MTHPSNLQREIFDACRSASSAVEQQEILDRECGEDSELRARVENLLRVYQGDLDYLEQPLDLLVTVPSGLDLAANQSSSVKVPKVGTVIGQYKLQQQIGEGGFGVVFMAQQSEPIRRRVALKVVKPGMSSKEVVGRFEAERQALALMDHPNIARVFDGGATLAGQPYFVMELVRGIPITKYADEKCLSTKQRLELIIDVCQAVQHAHQKGIIHRDLKPSNIMVSEIDNKAVPKVIDFGVAKALSQDLTDDTFFTLFDQVVGTPLYMSPEQAGVGVVDIDTRSDVYSLGVLLYELLTGRPPFDRDLLRKSGFDEFRRILREEEPKRPSFVVSTLKAEALTTICSQRSVDARRFSHLLRGELDWIVLKAIEKDRSRRYESPSELADDLRAFINGDPVKACPPTLGYRAQKLAVRYRAGLAVITAIFLALGVGLIIAIWQAMVASEASELASQATRQAEQRLLDEQAARQFADQQRERAERYLTQSIEAVDRLLEEVAQERLLNEPHMDDLRRRLLEDALAYCNQLSQEQDPSPDVQLRTARAAVRVAAIHRRLGDNDMAKEQARQAIKLLEALPKDFARASHAIELSKAYAIINNEAGYLRAIEVCKKVLEDDSDNVEVAKQYARNHADLANLLGSLQLQEHDRSIVLHQQAISIVEELIERQPGDDQLLSMLAGERNNLGIEYRNTGALERAKVEFEKAIELQRSTIELKETSRRRQFLGNHHFGIAQVFEMEQDFAKAEESYEKAIQQYERLMDSHPLVPSYQAIAARAHSKLAECATLGRNFAVAEKAAQRASQIYENLVRDFPESYQGYLGLAYSHQAFVHIEKSGPGMESRLAYEKSVASYRQQTKSQPNQPAWAYNLAGSLRNLAMHYEDEQKPEKVRETLEEAFQIINQLRKDYPDSIDYSRRCNIISGALADALSQAGLRDKAISTARLSLEVSQATKDRWPAIAEHDELLASSQRFLAALLVEQDQSEEAVQLLDMAIPTLERIVDNLPTPGNLYELASARLVRGQVAWKARDIKNAAVDIEKAEVNFRAICELDPEKKALRYDLAPALLWRALLIAESSTSRQGGSEIAAKLVDEAATILIEQLDDQGTTEVQRNLGELVQEPLLLAHEKFRVLISELNSDQI